MKTVSPAILAAEARELARWQSIQACFPNDLDYQFEALEAGISVETAMQRYPDWRKSQAKLQRKKTA